MEREIERTTKQYVVVRRDKFGECHLCFLRHTKNWRVSVPTVGTYHQAYRVVQELRMEFPDGRYFVTKLAPIIKGRRRKPHGT